MNFEATSALSALSVGLGATLTMDLWNLFLARAFGIPSLDYRLLGRWLRHIPEGTLRHAQIAEATPKRFEGAVGRIAHYAIGVALTVAFIAFVAPRGWLTRPTPAPALLYGVGTVVFPFFLLQPSLGLGVASSRAPRPALARLKSVATHTVFGFGLYASALGVGRVLSSSTGSGH